MISIEAHHATIGRFYNKSKRLRNIHASLLNGDEIYFILIGCILSFLPVTLYLLLLSFICITVDLFSFKFAKRMRNNTDYRNALLNSLDVRYNDYFKCNNSSKGDYVHPLNSKKKSLIRYLCLMLLLLSCIAFISYNVPTTVNSEGYMQTSNKHRNSLLKNLELYNLSFLKLNQLIVDGDVESNPGPTQNRINKSPGGRPKKSKGFRGTPKKQKIEEVQNVDFGAVQTASLNNINPWSVTCPCTIQSTSNLTFMVNNDINSKVSLLRGDITKLHVDAITNAANESLLGGSGIDEAIHNAAGTELRKQCSKFPEKFPGIRCETGECKVTKGYKLHAKKVFHTVGPRDQDENKLKACYESCLRNIAFCCIATGIFDFDRRKAAKIALSTIRNWLESNHVYVDRIIFCT